MSNIILNCPILSNITWYCSIWPNIVKYYLILFNIVQYGQILSSIAQYCPSDFFRSLFSELWYCKEHSDIFQYCQILPYVVRHWILSSNYQYCHVAPCVNIFLNTAISQPIQVWFRFSKNHSWSNRGVDVQVFRD